MVVPSTWSDAKRTGLPALVVLLPSFLWLAVTASILSALLLPVYALGWKKEFRMGVHAIYTMLHRPLVYLFEYSGSKVVIHGRNLKRDVLPHLGNNQGLVLSNHRGDLDWMVGLLLLDNGGGLGCCKAMIKQSLLSVPFFGFVWWCADFVCLKRNWAADATRLQEAYKAQHEYRELGVPYTLCVFPEGTRLSPAKLTSSQEFAKSRDWFIPKFLLLPRSKGLWSAINGLKLDAVYDSTIAVSSSSEGASLVTLAQGIPSEVHVHIETIVPADIPLEEDKFGNYLRSRWEMKDKLLADFADTGAFPGTTFDQSVVLKVHASARYYVIGSISWLLCSMVCFVWWSVRSAHWKLLFLCSGSFVMLIVALATALHFVHFQKDKKKCKLEKVNKKKD